MSQQHGRDGVSGQPIAVKAMGHNHALSLPAAVDGQVVRGNDMAVKGRFDHNLLRVIRLFKLCRIKATPLQNFPLAFQSSPLRIDGMGDGRVKNIDSCYGTNRCRKDCQTQTDKACGF